MPSYWIVKTEPSTYSYDDLERQKTAVWDGVKNNLSLKHLPQTKPGHQVLEDSTGPGRWSFSPWGVRNCRGTVRPLRSSSSASGLQARGLRGVSRSDCVFLSRREPPRSPS